MSKLYKKIAILIIVCFICMAFCAHNIVKKVKDFGGVKHVIIEAGKEIKDIKNQIDNN